MVAAPAGTRASARLWLRASVHAGPASSRIAEPSSVMNESRRSRMGTCTGDSVASALRGGFVRAAPPLLEPRPQLLRGHLPAEEVRRGGVAAEVPQLAPDRLGLHALRHHLEAEVAPKVDGRADDGHVVGL